MSRAFGQELQVDDASRAQPRRARLFARPLVFCGAGQVERRNVRWLRTFARIFACSTCGITLSSAACSYNQRASAHQTKATHGPNRGHTTQCENPRCSGGASKMQLPKLGGLEQARPRACSRRTGTSGVGLGRRPVPIRGEQATSRRYDRHHQSVRAAMRRPSPAHGDLHMDGDTARGDGLRRRKTRHPGRFSTGWCRSRAPLV